MAVEIQADREQKTGRGERWGPLQNVEGWDYICQYSRAAGNGEICLVVSISRLADGSPRHF